MARDEDVSSDEDRELPPGTSNDDNDGDDDDDDDYDDDDDDGDDDDDDDDDVVVLAPQTGEGAEGCSSSTSWFPPWPSVISGATQGPQRRVEVVTVLMTGRHTPPSGATVMGTAPVSCRSIAMATWNSRLHPVAAI
jgi:hypothetical protein